MIKIPVKFIKREHSVDIFFINNIQIGLSLLKKDVCRNLENIINKLYLELINGKIQNDTILSLNYKNVLSICFTVFKTEINNLINTKCKKMVEDKIFYNGNSYNFMNFFFDTTVIPPVEYSQFFLCIINELNIKLLHVVIQKVFKEKTNFSKYFPNINLSNLIDLCITNYREDFIKYISCKAHEVTQERTIITMKNLKEKIFFNKNYNISNTDFNKILSKTVSNEYQIQKKSFIQSNIIEINSNKDIWILYSIRGISLVKRTFDFTYFNPPLLKKEIMTFIKSNLQFRDSFIESSLDSITPILKIIIEKHPNITCFNDITQGSIDDTLLILETTPQKMYRRSDIEKKYSPSSLRKMIQKCSLAVDYLQNNPIKGIIPPKFNYFKNYTFYNSRNMEKRTDIIPDEIFDQLDLYSNDLSPDLKLIYDIFRNTGLRAKEVLFLQEDCLKECDEENLLILKYLPYKILNKLKLKGLSATTEILIPRSIGKLIAKQINNTKNLRNKYSTPFIFIIESQNGVKANIRSVQGIRYVINNLIQKNLTTDKDGSIWNFKTRQFRKTLISIMIENGATTHEISYWLGHLSRRTAKDYYEDFAKSKLAKLNTKFFEEKFQITLNKNEFAQYTEEERSCLYIDFLIGYRQVELGHCMKKIEEGPCGRDIGGMICANCSKLCTGKKYILEWIKLRDSAKEIVDELISVYSKSGIKDFENFREYQQESFYLNSYQKVIDEISKKIKEVIF